MSDAVWSAVAATGRPLAAAALNAGVGQGGAFVDTDIADEQEIIDTNISSPCAWRSSCCAT